MRFTSNPGRVAGILYLLLALLAPYRLMYIPSTLIVSGNASATASNIANNELLFRIGIITDLLCGVTIVFVTLALYRLFNDVNHNLAVLMVIVGGILPAAIDFFNPLNDAAALILIRGADSLSVFDQSQREALAMLFLRLHHQVVLGAEILWGLWLFPFGILAYRSGFLPRFLGVWLLINGAAYIIMSFIGFLFPNYETTVSNYLFPALLGEIAIILWLVIKGAKPQQLAAAA